MAAVIIGIADKTLVEGKKVFIRDEFGLERIQQEYYLKTTDLEFFAKEVFFNGNYYNEVFKYTKTYIGNPSGYNVSRPTPDTSGAGYAYMLVERIDYDSLAGDITLAQITYVGLFSVSNPKPKVDFLPILSPSQWAHHPYEISVKFVSYFGEVGSKTESLILEKKFTSPISSGGSTTDVYPAPRQINGYNFLFNKVEGYNLSADDWFKRFKSKANTLWIDPTCPFYCTSSKPNPIDPLSSITQNYVGKVQFFGFCIISFTLLRFGLFGYFQMVLRDAALQTGNYSQSDGPITNCIPCTSRLNLLG